VRRADHHLDLLLALSAERARQLVPRTGHAPTVPRQARRSPRVGSVSPPIVIRLRWPGAGTGHRIRGRDVTRQDQGRGLRAHGTDR
jgi:hypothetical protein